MTTEVKCPQCEKMVEWVKEEKWKPFCSERCKLIDLGAWADESYRVESKEQAASPTLFGSNEDDND